MYIAVISLVDFMTVVSHFSIIFTFVGTIPYSEFSIFHISFLVFINFIELKNIINFDAHLDLIYS